EGHPIPQPRPSRRVLLIMALIVVALGELFLLSPAFQILGLRDKPLLWFLPFTEQHLAATSSIAALLALAHALGENHQPSARPDRRPYAHRWAEPIGDVTATEQRSQVTSEANEAKIAEYNAAIDERDALISQYGHALTATASDAARQIELIAGHTRLSQPEPV